MNGKIMIRVIAAGAAFCASSVFAWDTPRIGNGMPLIFPDDSQVAAKTNTTRCLHVGVKDKEPVLRKDRPWEEKAACVYGSVWKMDDGRYRMWYCDWSWSNIADSMDGKTWTKPDLTVRPTKTCSTNNMCNGAWGHCNSLVYDRFEKNPARRYKHIGCGYKYNPDWSINKEITGYYTCVSGDGINFTDRKRALYGWDTSSLAQHPETGEIFCYHKINTRGYAGRDDRRRVVFVSRSRDFEKWTAPKLALAPDVADDESFTENPNQRMDIYTHTAFPYAGGFIGFLTMFRIDNRKPGSHGETGDQGFCDVQMATSPDGMVWNRTPGRKTVLTVGEPPRWDSGGIWGIAGGEVVSNEKESMLYYYGWDSAHGRAVRPGMAPGGTTRATGRAVWRRWGFASIGSTGAGSFTTKPVKLATADLRINMRPEFDPYKGKCALTVKILSRDGKRVLCESENLDKDDTLAKIVWKGGRKPPVDTPVRIKVDYHSASIYAFECL